MLHDLNVPKINGRHCRIPEHLTDMYPDQDLVSDRQFRTPPEPYPSPIQDPVDPPENPDVPVREPNPEDTGQI